MKKKYYQTTSGPLAYLVNNSTTAESLVFLHGLMCDRQYFKPQINFFQEDYRILAWDAPLHGESRPYEDFCFEQAVEDLHAILQQEEIEQPVLISHSMGGFIAQLYLKKYPENVRGLIFIDAISIDPAALSFLDRLSLEHYPLTLEAFDDFTLRQGIIYFNAETEGARHYMWEAMKTFTRREVIDTIAQYTDRFLAQRSPVDIQLPCQLIIGNLDQNQTIQRGMHQWAEELDLTLERIPAAGHCSSLDQAHDVNFRIKSFLDALPDTY